MNTQPPPPAPAETALAAQSKPESIIDLIKRKMPQVRTLLPKGMDAERMVRIALTEINRNPDLAKCSPASLMSGILNATMLGLEIGPHFGQAWLVPMNRSIQLPNGSWRKVKEAQLWLGYRGMQTLARRSGQIVSLTSHAVYAKDKFSYAYGLQDELKHVPYDGDDDRGDLRKVYAIAHLVGGGHQFVVLTRQEIEITKQRSPGAKKKDSPWNDMDGPGFPEMAMKTAIRKLFKYLPVSAVEIQRAAMLDEAAETGLVQPPAEGIEFTVDEWMSPGAEVIDGDFAAGAQEGETTSEEAPAATSARTKKLADSLKQQAAATAPEAPTT